jgi:hypothetical protein
MPPTKMVSLRLAPDVLEWVQARAASDQRSIAFIVMALARAEMAREAKAKTKAKTKKAKTAS